VTRTERRAHIDNLFREVVLVLGGAFAIRGTDSETIWRVARGLERVYRRARKRVDDAPAPRRDPFQPHPGLVRLLQLTRTANL
jgi:hypothetical protein